jgi:HSP20 family protein
VLRIPQGVDSSKISASFRDGVLKVVVPKSKEAKKKQRKVDIRAS